MNPLSYQNNMRILVAEDDPTTRTMLVGVLKKWGYDVVMVQDGQAAWELLQQPDAPRLVLLDWLMPGMDGLEVIRRVRALINDQPPYIILLTSKDARGDIISGLESGANDYIKKPFDNEELTARMRVGQRTLELQTRLYDAQQTLAHLAAHDPLTGMLNRRAILEQLSKEISRAGREDDHARRAGLSTRRVLWVGFIDIDDFKLINDAHGHQGGDDVLKAVAGILGSHLRVYDTFGRLGGDEFLVVAPGSEAENDLHLFERLSTAIAASKIITATGEVSVTVSIGVATGNVESSLDTLLDAADAAMYQAKHAGGNRVVYAG